MKHMKLICGLLGGLLFSGTASATLTDLGNGLIYDDRGRPIFRGNVLMMYDVAVYIGYFTDLEMAWHANSPFSLNGSFNFKAERILWMLSTVAGPRLDTDVPHQRMIDSGTGRGLA